MKTHYPKPNEAQEIQEFNAQNGMVRCRFGQWKGGCKIDFKRQQEVSFWPNEFAAAILERKRLDDARRETDKERRPSWARRQTRREGRAFVRTC